MPAQPAHGVKLLLTTVSLNVFSEKSSEQTALGSGLREHKYWMEMVLASDFCTSVRVKAAVTSS